MRPAAGGTTGNAAAGLADLVPLLVEVGDGKRIGAAHLGGTLAESSFRGAWAALVAGADPTDVALRGTAAAIVAARLGAIDGAVLVRCGMGEEGARAALLVAFDEVASPLAEGWRSRLREEVGKHAPEDGPAPSFVELLARQPRAGATRPGRGRLILEPPESHADHCWAVAVYAVLLCASFDADPGVVFLAGLSHHLHNAALPDSGYAADTILADHVGGIQARLREEALDGLPGELREGVSGALERVVGRADNPEARAFQAADVLDRVLQMDQYARVAAFTLEEALGEMDLVHPGPEQEFHLSVLSGAGLR